MLPLSKLLAGETAPQVSFEERSETSGVVTQKAQALADCIKNSRHFIAFTGAGISTTAGIKAFRNQCVPQIYVTNLYHERHS
jgi:hypothetical protein